MTLSTLLYQLWQRLPLLLIAFLCIGTVYALPVKGNLPHPNPFGPLPSTLIQPEQNTGMLLSEFNRNETVSKDFFIENKGQWAPEVKYLVRIGGLNAWITKTGIVYDFYKIARTESDKPLDMPQRPDEKDMNSENTRISGHVVRMLLDESRTSAGFDGEGKQEGYYNYFIGNDESKWASNVPLFNEVNVNEIYKKIDARYYFDEEGLRYDFVLNPGADINDIKLKFEGADGITVNAAGDLVIKTSLGEVTQQKLYAYQEIDGYNQQVACRFTQTETGAITFTADWKDKTKPLVIDPLIYSTFLGGGSDDYGNSIALGADGSAYVTGYTYSSDFPTTAGAYDVSHNGGGVYYDAFITKLNPAGSALVYSTFLGGGSADYGNSIAISTDGSAYVTGDTYSSDFPTTAGAYDVSQNGSWDAFITKLNPAGSALVYSTFLGGGYYDYGNSIALGSDGSAFVTGYTYSSDYPATAGAFDVTQNGSYDAFITKLNPAGSVLTYSTFLGGASEDYGNSIALGSDGSAFVTGYTFSTDFPTTAGAFDETKNGGWDAFITKLNPAGSALVYSTFLGGGYYDYGNSIALGTDGSAYVTGYTGSSDFPTTAGAFDETYNGSYDAFITKLNPAGSALVYSTYLGGGGEDYGNSIALGADGSAYVTGYTFSSDFPTTTGAFDVSHNGGSDVFITKLNPAGSALGYSTFLGGGTGDRGFSIALGIDGSAFVTGLTGSSNFPTTAGAFDVTHNGGTYDAFVINISDVNLDNPDPLVSTDTLYAIDGDTVLVPINIKDFYSVGAVTLKLNYNPAVLTFIEPINWLPTSPLWFAHGNNGTVTIAGSDIAGITAVNEKLVDLKFVYTGGTTPVTFNAAGCEIADIYERPLELLYVNGAVIEIFGYDVSGTVKYRNAALTPLIGVSIDLMHSGTVVDTKVTDNTGAFLFASVSRGTYPLVAHTTASWGGVNSTDALALLRYVIGARTLDTLQILAADVNGNNILNATDALLIRRRVVGFDTSFVRGYWAFETPSVTVAYSAVVRNVLGLCIGDVNGSYTPGLLKANPTVNFLAQGSVEAQSGKEIVLPLFISASEKIGAVTLRFEYSASSLDITGVTSSLEGILYSAQDGILSISWADIAGASFDADEPLLRITASVKEGQGNDLKLKLMPEYSEFADIEANVMQSVTVSAPEIGLSLPTEFRLSQNFPNPFNPSTTIEYDVPLEGKVRIEIFNTLGESVEVLMDAVQAPGRYSAVWNAKNSTSGVYFYRMTAETGTKNFTQVKKLMLVK